MKIASKFHAGGNFGWVNTGLTNCQILLRGSAAYTVGFRKVFGLVDTAGERWQAVELELAVIDENAN